MVCLAVAIFVLLGALAPASWASIHPLTESNINLLLSVHNEMRRNERSGLQDLTWNEELASRAQNWADGCFYGNERNVPFGENIAARKYMIGTDSSAIVFIMQNWMEESLVNTDGSFSCCTKEDWSCCHLKQVLQPMATTVGCGIKFCESLPSQFDELTDAAYLVCYYDAR
ncbi:venom allergen-like protein 1 [Elysia marginata]|uniref:Venom allergen-like protein 1 n=1 Tax=Elysia marginata TaxID=1093978 RepID=A0AAV4GSY9_9GAST|nr:venom allergen-like protein 1 [Elysia marginata]